MFLRRLSITVAIIAFAFSTEASADGWKTELEELRARVEALESSETQEPITIEDAEGRTVGLLIDIVWASFPLQQLWSVFLTYEGVRYIVGIHKEGENFVSNGIISFESSDCSGPGYLNRNDATVPFNAVTATIHSDGRMWIPLADPLSVVRRSYLHLHVIREDDCVSQPPTLATRYATEMIDLYSLFTPPFRVR